VLSVALIALSLAAAPLARAASPTLTLDFASVQPGAIVIVDGDGYPGDADVSIVLTGASIPDAEVGAGKTDATGHIHTSATIPAPLALGTYRLEARSGDVVGAADITIVGPLTGDPSAASESDGGFGPAVLPASTEEVGAPGANVIAATPVPAAEGPTDIVTQTSLLPGVLLVAGIGLATVAFIGAGLFIARRE
jgi:hypothetical protein